MSYKVAGIDVHKKVLMVVVIDASTPEEKPERRRFTTMPSDLPRLFCWLREQGVEEAVMESTAQYGPCGWNENRICDCSWRKRSPTVPHGGANMTSRTPNGWCGG
jgi:hypothetical protein